MVICVSYCLNLVLVKIWKKKNNNDERRISTHLLTLIVKVLKINVENGRVVTTLNIISSVVNQNWYYVEHIL